MPLPAKTIDPLAAYLDASVDAQHAGVAQSDIDLLTEIGEIYADAARQAAERVNRLTDGRMVTTWISPGRGERRYLMAPATASDLAVSMIEGSLDLLDAVPVIKASAALRLNRPARVRDLIAPVAARLAVA